MMRYSIASSVVATVAILLVTSCGGEQDTRERGEIAFSVAGNEAVRVGFPHEENGSELGFVDGWQADIDTFLISLGSVDLTESTPDGDGEVLASWTQGAVVDVAADESGEVFLMTLSDVPEGRHDVRFSITSPGQGFDGSSVSAADLDLMKQNNWSMVLRGTATPNPDHPEFSEPIKFDIGLDISADYNECINGVDGTRGAIVPASRQNEAYIYPHLVHLFWDTLGAGNEELRFDAMARAAGDDGVVTIDELDAVSLLDPALTDAEGIPLYDDAGLLDTYTLGAFIRRAMLESVHFNGIGFCKKRITR